MKPVPSKAGGTVRCAIYTRKSSEEGLEQGFNSLDAQHEACAAYILSQASEGWTQLSERYDDGGLSGGTLERPALQRLLADVAAKRVDIIVVYKVDRLTRSLLDFAKLVEAFDKAGVSFVSITQSFNTTTSMGRLTLNMLLSFAQFEREVTAERIRDKIAASKAKGMWMGGTPPLGYKPDGRSLAVVEEHAALIRHIFRRYLALGTVRLVADELQAQGIGLPTRQRHSGNGSYGGGAFTRGQLYKILANPIYIGRIPHGDRTYAGLHPAIVDTDAWEQAQSQLADNRQGTRERVRAASPSLLAGKLTDEAGEPLIATHAAVGPRRYRYYVSEALHHARTSDGARIPARELDAAVTGRAAQLFDDPVQLAAQAWLTIPADRFLQATARAKEIAVKLQQRDRIVTRQLVSAVRIERGRITIEITTSAVADLMQLELAPQAPASITLVSDVRLTRSGRAMRLVHRDGSHQTTEPNRSLARLLAQAHRYWRELRRGEVNVSMLASAEGVSPAYLTRVLRLAFLSPAVTDAILLGRQREGVDALAITAPGAVDPDWRVQATAFLPRANIAAI